eukprot:TCONS_00009914-protein
MDFLEYLVIRSLFTALVVLVNAPLQRVDGLSSVAEIYNANSFDLIRSSSYPHFVMFHAPWCSHCTKMSPVWDEYARQNHKLKRMKIAKLDCSEYTPLCASEKIKAYPTFRLFDQYKAFTFRGTTRSIREFNKFVEQKSPNIKNGKVPEASDKQHKTHSSTQQKQQPKKRQGVVELTEDSFEKVVADGITFVDFFAPWCSHCRKLEPVWKQLADRFAHDSRVTIAKVDCTAQPNLCTSKSISAYPTLNLYKEGNQLSAYNYDRTLEALTSFINNVLDTEPQPSSMDDQMAGEEFPVVEQEGNLPKAHENPAPIYSNNLKTVKWLDRFQIDEELTQKPLVVYLHDPWQPESVKGLAEFEELGRIMDKVDMKITPVFFSCTTDKAYCQKFTDKSPTVVFFHSSDDYILYTRKMVPSALLAFIKEASTVHTKQEL